MQYTLPMAFRVLRAERGLSLRDAEKLTGVDRATISDLEHGKRRPQDTTLARLCRGYGVELADILEKYDAAGKDGAPRQPGQHDQPYLFFIDPHSREDDLHSREELRHELSSAHQRIRELEAEVARLRERQA